MAIVRHHVLRDILITYFTYRLKNIRRVIWIHFMTAGTTDPSRCNYILQHIKNLMKFDWHETFLRVFRTWALIILLLLSIFLSRKDIKFFLLRRLWNFQLFLDTSLTFFFKVYLRFLLLLKLWFLNLFIICSHIKSISLALDAVCVLNMF